MTKRAIVRYGDRTTHGGTVISGDLTYAIYGKSVARVGDMVRCPQCNDTYPIISGAYDVWSKHQIARHDDETACGAKLIASQHTATINDGVGQTSLAEEVHALVPLTSNDLDDEDVFVLQFQAIDPATGTACPACIYILTREDGTQHGGVTDANGFTAIIKAMQPEQIDIHFMFKSSKGEQIERADLIV
jgi:uncharacterized Zn-binding protein involved in type VI secretion